MSFEDILLLNKVYNRNVKRAGRFTIGVFVNAAFSLFAAYILLSSFALYSRSQDEFLGALAAVSIAVVAFTELFNIINMNFVDNIFSQRAIQVLPVSQTRLFADIFVNNFIGVRLLLYSVPSAIILYYSSGPGIAHAGFLLVWIIFVYSLSTLFYAAVDYVYGLVKYKFAQGTEKIVMIASILILVALYWISKQRFISLRHFNEVTFHLMNYIAPRNG